MKEKGARGKAQGARLKGQGLGAGMNEVRRATPDDAGAIRRIAESLRYAPPGSEKGFLVHIRSEGGYRSILEISKHSVVAEEDGRIVGFLLVHTMAELEKLAAGVPGRDEVVRYVLELGDTLAVYADQIGVSLDARSRGIGQSLAETMAKEHPNAHFLAAIMHQPARNGVSLRLAQRNGWTLRTEIPENEFIWGIYEKRTNEGARRLQVIYKYHQPLDCRSGVRTGESTHAVSVPGKEF